MMYEDLRSLKNNSEVRAYLNKKSKQSLVDYYFRNLSTATDKARYLKKSKEDLVEMIMNHYSYIRRDEALDKIKL